MRGWRSWWYLAGCLALLLVPARALPEAVAAPDGQKSAALQAAWVQLGPDGVVLARAITLADTCPTLDLDGGPRPLRERAAPAPPAFPERVCESEVPAGATTAAIAGQLLPVPQGPPRRIVVFGDTGCRVEPPRVQACRDPEQWPFAAVARQAAAWQPDLVIHVGDYYYREEPCPADFAGCRGSPWGDNWDTWTADFFTPAEPLLRAAPWVLVRGNHELCARGGQGWFRWLDPFPPAPCSDFTPPYSVPLGAQRLLVLDSAAANDSEAPPDLVATYGEQLATLAAAAGPRAWLTTHRPFWGVAHRGEADGVEQLFRPNATLQAAARQQWPAGVQLVLSGHVHLFELLDYGAARPPQLVAGTGGTLLDAAVTTPLAGVEIDGVPIAAGHAAQRFGFVTLEAAGDDWELTLRDVAGTPVYACTLRERATACTR